MPCSLSEWQVSWLTEKSASHRCQQNWGQGEKSMRTFSRARFARLTAVMFAVLAYGCAALNPTAATQRGTTAQAAPTLIPRVENCAVVNIGSPSKFACNGKVYTTFELAKIREQAAK